MQTTQHPNALWIQLLWTAMQKTGHGYRHHALRNTGVGADRRKDKLIADGQGIESKLERLARRGHVGMRPGLVAPDWKRSPSEERRIYNRKARAVGMR